ncbi:MAG: glutamate synthase-related protein [Anaerolineales bacterium]
MTHYHRYQIATQPAPPRARHPSRFRVRVSRVRLAQLIFGELIHYRGDLPVVLSRPCVYGVFSGPVGGFAPREQLCVGCLRCTVQYPDMVQVTPNPARLALGDSYMDPDRVDTILYEAATGRVPVRGAGYRGRFSGPGWDSMWTDMSEIVRPTRDGIHGREFISTAVDLGQRPSFLQLDASGTPVAERPRSLALPVPFIFDRPALSIRTPELMGVLAGAAAAVQTLWLAPIDWALRESSVRSGVVPIVRPSDREQLRRLPTPPEVFEIEGWDRAPACEIRVQFPKSLIVVRAPFGENLLAWVEDGFRLFHLTADYHGHTPVGFVLDAIRAAHESLVTAGVREQVTLVGSGGIIAPEHLAKAIVSGLDLVALDTALWVALQAGCLGECRTEEAARFSLPELDPTWGIQRLANLSSAWRDELLEVLGAMGIRDVRRLRGEVGRAMFQPELEREAFAGIPGYPDDEIAVRD